MNKKKPKSKKVVLSSHKTAYTLSGDIHHPTIVLIHGLGLHRHMWQSYQKLLSERFRVLSYDLLGHNETQTPFENLSLTVFAEQLKNLFDDLQIDTAILVGFSLGGMINRRFAIDYPNRVNALCILNSPHQRTPQQQQKVELRAEQTEQEGIQSTLEETLKRWFTKDFYQHNPNAIEQIRQGVLANHLPHYAAARQVLAKGVIELINPQPAITLPTLVMTCENDSGSTPAMSIAIGAEIPNSQVIIVPHLQHMGLCENVDAFYQPIVKFLSTIMLKKE